MRGFGVAMMVAGVLVACAGALFAAAPHAGGTIEMGIVGALAGMALCGIGLGLHGLAQILAMLRRIVPGPH